LRRGEGSAGGSREEGGSGSFLVKRKIRLVLPKRRIGLTGSGEKGGVYSGRLGSSRGGDGGEGSATARSIQGRPRLKGKEATHHFREEGSIAFSRGEGKGGVPRKRTERAFIDLRRGRTEKELRRRGQKRSPSQFREKRAHLFLSLCPHQQRREKRKKETAHSISESKKGEKSSPLSRHSPKRGGTKQKDRPASLSLLSSTAKRSRKSRSHLGIAKAVICSTPGRKGKKEPA